MSWLNLSGPLGKDAAQAIDLDRCVISRDRKYSIEIRNMKAMFEDMGKSVITTMEDIGYYAMTAIVRNIAT